MNLRGIHEIGAWKKSWICEDHELWNHEMRGPPVPLHSFRTLEYDISYLIFNQIFLQIKRQGVHWNLLWSEFLAVSSKIWLIGKKPNFVNFRSDSVVIVVDARGHYVKMTSGEQQVPTRIETGFWFSLLHQKWFCRILNSAIIVFQISQPRTFK